MQVVSYFPNRTYRKNAGRIIAAEYGKSLKSLIFNKLRNYNV